MLKVKVHFGEDFVIFFNKRSALRVFGHIGVPE